MKPSSLWGLEFGFKSESQNSKAQTALKIAANSKPFGIGIEMGEEKADSDSDTDPDTSESLQSTPISYARVRQGA